MTTPQASCAECRWLCGALVSECPEHGHASRVRRELLIRCDLHCRCADHTCTACELRQLVEDLPTFVALASDRCACEQEQACTACRIARPGPGDPPAVRDGMERAWRDYDAARACTFCDTVYSSPLPRCSTPLCEARPCPEHRDADHVCAECQLTPGHLLAETERLFA